MISTTKSARKESSHYYTVVTYGQYYNQIVNHPKKDKTLFYVVTKKTIMTTQRITLGKNLDSFFNINYNKLMNDITNAQEQSQNYTLPPDVLRDLVVGNSKLNKNKLNKLLKMNSNAVTVTTTTTPHQTKAMEMMMMMIRMMMTRTVMKTTMMMATMTTTTRK